MFSSYNSSMISLEYDIILEFELFDRTDCLKIIIQDWYNLPCLNTPLWRSPDESSFDLEFGCHREIHNTWKGVWVQNKGRRMAVRNSCSQVTSFVAPVEQGLRFSSVDKDELTNKYKISMRNGISDIEQKMYNLKKAGWIFWNKIVTSGCHHWLGCWPHKNCICSQAVSTVQVQKVLNNCI